MATIMMAWELGSGLGHLAQLAPLARELVSRGHRVVAVLKELARADKVIALGEGITYLQAPHRNRSDGHEIRVPVSFPHVLHNSGYSNETELRTLASAWRSNFQLVRPDLLICDHSPTALLASRGLPIRRVVIGSGFICPPDQYPMPNLRTWMNVDLPALKRNEDELLARMNSVLRANRQPHLDRIAQLYQDVDETCLTTYPELDHYMDRPKSRYYGDHCTVPGREPRWPAGGPKRVFAYLKSSKAGIRLLTWLRESGHSVLVFGDGLQAELRNRLTGPTMTFAAEPVDIALAAKQCDAGVLNATHATTVQFLKAGKPVLHLPLHVEQALTARAVQRMGAGIDVPAGKSSQVIPSMQRVLDDPQFVKGAQSFAHRHSGESPANQIGAITRRLANLLTKASPFRG